MRDITTYTHHRLRGETLPSERDIVIYLPEAYYREPDRHFPVLYLQDGNNLFEPETAFCGQIWAADKALEAGVRAGEIEPVILVGIGNTPERTQEYTWHPFQIAPDRSFGGWGAYYCDFVVNHVKPLIDSRYRTRPERESTAILGSSLGGLISFYFGLYYPEIFGSIGLMSPSLGWGRNRAFQEVQALSRDLRIWIDIGTREASCHGDCSNWMVKNTAAFVRALEDVGFRHFENLAFHIAEGADHSENAWADRIGHVLRFMFPRQGAGRSPQLFMPPQEPLRRAA